MAVTKGANPRKASTATGTGFKKIHLNPSQLPTVSPIALRQEKVDHADH